MKLAKITLTVVLILLFSSKPFAGTDHSGIYKPGTKFILTVTYWGLSANGVMEVLGNTKFRGKDTILVRSHVTEFGGFLGFIVKFLRIYKESNTFDSYIDPDTFMPVRYEVYKLNKDGSKKLTEHIYFNRKSDQVVSIEDNIVILSSTEPDIQDTFSSFLNLIHRFNDEGLSVGRKFNINLYAYRKTSKIEVKVIEQAWVNGKPVYTLKIDKLPGIFKYPASVTFEVADGKNLKVPTKGKCVIDVPVLPDITVNGILSRMSN